MMTQFDFSPRNIFQLLRDAGNEFYTDETVKTFTVDGNLNRTTYEYEQVEVTYTQGSVFTETWTGLTYKVARFTETSIIVVPTAKDANVMWLSVPPNKHHEFLS